MAKKTISPQEAVKIWKLVTQRASLSNYYIVNGILLSKSTSGHNIIMVPDQSLLTLITEDKDITIIDFDPSNDDLKDQQRWFVYGERLDGDAWVPLTDNEDFYNGKYLEITIKGHSFPILISKELLPVKLLKSEFNNVHYRVFLDPAVLAIKKRFDIIPDHGFTVMRLFQII